MRLRCLALVVSLAHVAQAQTVPTGFSATNINTATTLSSPTAMDIAPDGRIFVCEQGGSLRIVDPISGATSTFHSFGNITSGSERGLLGVTFDPAFAQNGFIYAYLTRAGPTFHNAVVRIKVGANPGTSDGTETDLLALNDLGPTIHNGGALHFGPDGKLYIGVGENNNSANSQSLTNLLGKILRINADGSIPSDNPASFAGISGSTTGINRACWAVGLRNPFTFGFHPVTGRLFINDVGNTAWEEINDGQAGANYGWSITEGDFNQAAFPSLTRPLFTYSHSSGPFTGFCIAGAAFYNPSAFSFPPEYLGDYFFGDYVMSWVRRIDPATGTVTLFASNASGVVDLRTDAQGDLIMLLRDAGRVSRVHYGAALSPSILTHPFPSTIPAGSVATFTVYAAGNQPLSYQWRRDQVGLADGGSISGARTATLTISGAACADAGNYDCFVSNAAGNATSNPASLAIIGGVPGISGQPQSLSISTGQAASFTVSATGPQPMTYQWFKDAAPLSDSSRISGSHADTLTIAPTIATDAGAYSVAVHNSCGTTPSDAATLSLSCVANCDHSTNPPVLNANDFQCFLNLYAAADPGANCDGSSNPPILNANDFQCFLNAFATGCP